MKAKNFLAGRFFVLFATWQLVGIIGVVFPVLLLIYLLAILPIVLLLLADRQTLVGSDAFQGTISGPRSPELGREIELDCTMEANQPKAFRLPSVRLQTPYLEPLRFQDPRTDFTKVEHDGITFFQTSLKARASSLGYGEINSLTLQIGSLFGFWMRELNIPSEKYSFRVVPQMHDVPEQVFSEVVANQSLLYQGSRLVMRGRTVDQFYSIREYQYPDSIRHIDHKKTARFGKLMTRIYDSFHSHHLLLVLDLGRPLYGEVLGSKKHDYYLSVCLLLAQHAVTSRDQVSFLAFSQKPHLRISRVRSLKPFHALFQGSEQLIAREEDSNYELLNLLIPQMAGQRSIVLILTDLSKPYVQESLLQTLAPICKKHLTVVLSLLDRRYDLRTQITSFDQPALSKEHMAKILYSYWLSERSRLFVNQIAQVGGAAVTISEEYWMSTAQRVYSMLRSSTRV